MGKYRGLCIGGPAQGLVLTSDSVELEERERLGTGGPEYIRNMYYFYTVIMPDDLGVDGIYLHESMSLDDAEEYMKQRGIKYGKIG